MWKIIKDKTRRKTLSKEVKMKPSVKAGVEYGKKNYYREGYYCIESCCEITAQKEAEEIEGIIMDAILSINQIRKLNENLQMGDNVTEKGVELFKFNLIKKLKAKRLK